MKLGVGKAKVFLHLAKVKIQRCLREPGIPTFYPAPPITFLDTSHHPMTFLSLFFKL